MGNPKSSLIRLVHTFAFIVLVTMVGFVATPRADAAFIAEVKDPAGDSTSSHPGRDLIGVGIGFNQKTGYMVGAVRFRGAPDSDNGAFLTLYAGMRTSSGCNGFPAGGFGAYTDSWNAYWLRLDGPGQARSGEADKTGYLDEVQTFEVRTKKLAGKKWNCLTAALTDPDDTQIVFDQASSPNFRGLPELAVKVPRIKRAVPVNRVRKIRIRIANPGDAPLRRVRVKIGRDRGVSPRPRSRIIRAIPPRKHRVISIAVRPRRTAFSTADLKVKVQAGRLRATREVRIRIKHPRPKPSGGGGSGGGGGVCTQFFPDLSGETGGSLGLVPC